MKLKKVKSDAAQLKASETKVAEVTESVEQIDTKMADVASMEPTVSEDKNSAAVVIQQMEEAAELQNIKHEIEAVDILPTTQPSVELAKAEAVQVSTKVGEALAVTADTEPFILEQVIVSDVKAVSTGQAIQKSEEPLQEATTGNSVILNISVVCINIFFRIVDTVLFLLHYFLKVYLFKEFFS